MSMITLFDDVGVKAETVGDSIKLSGLSRLSPEQKEFVVEFARTHKAAILMAMNQTGKPGECESCPAAGYWDHSHYSGQGLQCFHDAYFLHKSGKPSPCTEMKVKCPRIE
jgi:hypothetical protein